MTAVLERDRRDKRPALLWAWRLLRLDFTGIAFAALFFCLSLTPSLLPRDWLFAGLIGGITRPIGYGIGVFVVKINDLSSVVNGSRQLAAIPNHPCILGKFFYVID